MTTDFTSTPHRDTPAPERRISADELARLGSETQALSITAAHAIAQQTLARVRDMERPAPDKEATALLADLRAKLRAAEAEWSTGGRAAQRAQHRVMCDALRLFRVCGRRSCRKAQVCTGNAIACFQNAEAPEPVLDFVMLMMLRGRVPALALLSRTPPEQRAAYEGWIAGIEAGR